MKVKLLEGGTLPKRAHDGDAGYDLYSPIDFIIPAQGKIQVKLGIAIELPKNSFGQIVERSGDAIKHSVFSIGPIIDENYRGEISAILANLSFETVGYTKGNRIAQLLVLPLHQDQEIVIVNELSESNRGINAHHSSGR